MEGVDVASIVLVAKTPAKLKGRVLSRGSGMRANVGRTVASADDDGWALDHVVKV